MTRLAGNGHYPNSIEVRHLEPVFEAITPLPGGINIVKSVVWALDEKRSARLIRMTPANIHFKAGQLEKIEENLLPITYYAYMAYGRQHSLGNYVLAQSASWMTHGDGSVAHHMENGDMLHGFSEEESANLDNTEDIFEAYDAFLRKKKGYQGALIPTHNLPDVNVFTPDGLEQLALTAPRH